MLDATIRIPANNFYFESRRLDLVLEELCQIKKNITEKYLFGEYLIMVENKNKTKFLKLKRGFETQTNFILLKKSIFIP